MLRVDRIELREIRLPLREPFRISSGVLTARRITLLELVDADGLVAWSECVAEELPNYSPDTAGTSWLALREWLAPRVLGRGFASPDDLWPVSITNPTMRMKRPVPLVIFRMFKTT